MLTSASQQARCRPPSQMLPSTEPDKVFQRSWTASGSRVWRCRRTGSIPRLMVEQPWPAQRQGMLTSRARPRARLEKRMVQATSPGVPVRAHVVLASADSEAFTSLRRRSTSRRDRYRMGKELRRQVPRRSLGDWSAPACRPNPVRLISESHRGRLDWLIPVRVGRMAASPYGFMRGAAIVMAEDVAGLPCTGITPNTTDLGAVPVYARL